jgi:hypothetical protein
MNGKAVCFFCGEGEIEGKAYHEGKAIDGQDVAIGICPDCVGSLGTLLADITCELEDGMPRAGFLRQALAKVEAAAWEALALNQEGAAVRRTLEAAICQV